MDWTGDADGFADPAGIMADFWSVAFFFERVGRD